MALMTCRNGSQLLLGSEMRLSEDSDGLFDPVGGLVVDFELAWLRRMYRRAVWR